MTDTQENVKKTKKKEKPITVKPNKKGRHIMPIVNFLRILVVPVYYLLKPFRFYGNRKVKDGACVYISNHYTLLDPVYIATTTWEGIHFIGKKSISKTPILRGIAKKAKMIPVSRDGNDVRALLDCFKCLKNNEKVAIYPEGTRNKTGDILMDFKHGAAIIAIKTQTPVIPVMIYRKPRFFRCTHILIGEPIELTEYYGRKLTDSEYAEADEKLRKYMLKMHAEHTAYLKSKKKKKKDN